MSCILCGKEVTDKVVIFGNHVVCKSCYDCHSFSYCDICDELTPDDWMEEIFEDEDDLWKSACPKCFKEHEGRYPHDYKPSPIFHSGSFGADRKNCLHVGVELELEGRRNFDFLRELDNKFSEDFFYTKYDGSLNEEEGCEINANPMILPIALENFEKLFKIINKYNMEGTPNCGLHCHLDRIYLNDRQIRNLDFIVNTFTKSIEKIGGRDVEGNEWACNIHKRVEDWGTVTREDYKYRAMNFCKNTIELRCFNSTDDWFYFRSILIAVFALVEYAKIHKFDYFYCMNDNKFWTSFNKFMNRYIKKNRI